MNIAWNRSPINGSANFDIEGDAKQSQLSFFYVKKLSKIEKFKEALKEKVLSKEIKNNSEALNFVYHEGHIGKHASECLKEMKKNKQISLDGPSPLVNYIKVFKEKRNVEFKIIF